MKRKYYNYDKDCIQCGNKMKHSSYKDLCSTCGRKKKQSILSKIPCVCGCGEFIPSKTQNSKPILYAHGHNVGRGRNHIRFEEVSKPLYGYTTTYCPDHPFRNNQNRVKTHRLILEQCLSEKYRMKIYLLPYFDVHHIDLNKKNNDPSNLQYLTRKEHMKAHWEERRSKYTS